MSTLNKYTCQLSSEEKIYLAANLNETDEIRPIKIAEIRQWIIQNNDLYAPTGSKFILNLNIILLSYISVKKLYICMYIIFYIFIDDFFILRFLRACKFNVEKTKSKLWNYYKQRANLPEWYSNRNPFLPELQELFNLG